MRVLRIEWPNGVGFYSGGGSQLMDYENDEYTHPDPYSDSRYHNNLQAHMRAMGPFWRSSCLFFGFDSTAQLRRWFYNDQWIRNMQEHELLVQEYEVDAQWCVFGRAQMTFEMAKATLVHTWSPADLLDGFVNV